MQGEKIAERCVMCDLVASLDWVVIKGKSQELTCNLRCDGQKEEI